MNKNKKRSTFSGKLGFVLSAAGASVGLEIFGDFHIWQRNMVEESFTGLHHTGTDIWLYHDYGREFFRTYDQKESRWCI